MGTFTPLASYGSSKEVKPRNLEAKFGDGYEQSLPDGINTKPRIYNLRFTLLDAVDGDEIETFIDDHDTIPFNWTPPFESVSARFKCKKYTRTYTSGLISNITCKFEEVFF